MTRMIEGFFGFEIFDSGILGDYFGFDFWSRDSFLVLLEALGIFWGFNICPHHLKSGVPPTWGCLANSTMVQL